MVNTNSGVPKEGKEPPTNMVIQTPNPVPPARKGQQNIQGTKGKSAPTQKQLKGSPQAQPIQNGHPSPSSQTASLVSPVQQQQSMQPKKVAPNQIPQNMVISQNNSKPQGNQIPGAKTQQPHPQQKVIPLQNPDKQQITQQRDSTNLPCEPDKPPTQATNSQVVIPKLPVDTVKPTNDAIKTLPVQSIQPANQTVNTPLTCTKLPAESIKSSTDNTKPQPVQPFQQTKQITNSPVPSKKLPVDSVKPPSDGTKPLPGQPIQQAKQILGQHITRKISQTQPPLTEQQMQQFSKPQDTQLPQVRNKVPKQVASPATPLDAQNLLPNDDELKITVNTESSVPVESSGQSSGQYPNSIVKVAQNVLKSPLVKTKRPRDISATRAPSVPTSPIQETNTTEAITSSFNKTDIEKVDPVSNHSVVMKIPPKYDSRGNANDPPKLGDMLQRAAKSASSCPSSPEIVSPVNVLPTTTVIVTPATPVIKEQIAPVNFKTISQDIDSPIQNSNQSNAPAKEVIPNPMQFPAVDGKQGGGGSTSITSHAKEATKIGGIVAENSSILARDAGLLTPAVPGQEPKIPGLITPPPSPPILSSLEEEKRNQIAEDISETTQEMEKEVDNLAANHGVQVATNEKVMNVGGQKERSEVDGSQIKVLSVKDIQKSSQENTTPADTAQNPNIKGGSEDTSTRKDHLSGDTAVIKVDNEGNCTNEGVVLGKITLGSVADKLPRLDTNNNASEYFSKLYGKELSSLEAKFEEQVQQLKLALNQKQEELAKAKAEAEKILKQSEERSKREQQELKERSTKEQHDLKERLEREKQELEDKLRLEREERDKKELEERQKREEQRESEKKAAETASNEKNTSEDLNKDEGKEGDEEEEESEAESNKRKWDKLQMEILSLKQQNEEFEEMVREKHRRQIELELQIGEIGKEVTAKEAMVDSVKVELCYAKNETELTKARVKRMEEELAQYKEKVESLEQELDTSERELKRMEILQEKLQVTETKRNELQAQLDEVELERDEEIKIIQDALDEAAQEREELLVTFEKEIEKLNSVNAAREAQMLEDFETKLCELEQQHKAKLEEKERQSETTLTRGKRQPDQEEIRQRIEKMKSELNSEWEDKLRNECSRLKGELDTLHVEEKHLAVESIKVQKEQELQNLKKTFESKSEEMNKEIATLKESLSTKDAFYHKELDEIRTRADRDLWEMRRKLQKLDESSYDRQQYLEDKHREDIERLREEYSDKMAGMESQLSSVDIRGIADVRAKLEKMHKEQMEHLEQQHRLSMERLRDELESEKFQAAEEARVIVTKHHEYINSTLKDQLTEAITANTQYREEIDAIRFALSRREEVIRSLEEEITKLRSSKAVTPPTGSSYAPPAAAGGHGSPSPFSHEGSQGSRSSQDRLSNEGVDEDGHRASGLLGKVFGGGWFSGTKTKDNTSPGYNNSSGNGSARRGSGLYRQAW